MAAHRLAAVALLAVALAAVGVERVGATQYNLNNGSNATATDQLCTGNTNSTKDIVCAAPLVPKSDKKCEPNCDSMSCCGQAVSITMTIPGDVAAIVSNPTVKAAFEAAFATDIAAHLSIAANRITVTSITAGSIVVTYTIAPDASGTQVSAAAVQTKLASPINFTAIKTSAVIPSSIKTAYASPVTATGITATVVTAPGPEPEPEPPSNDITLDKSGVGSIQITALLVLAPMVVLTLLHN
jgi:hypothetical protein